MTNPRKITILEILRSKKLLILLLMGFASGLPFPLTHGTLQAWMKNAGWSIDEMLMDSRSKSPDMEMVETDDLSHVMQLLDKMDKREATVLRMRFGLDDEEPKTLKEIGECLGLTRERVRQIESEALSKLSESMQAE